MNLNLRNLNLNHYSDCTLEEILAYQQLESEYFDFGQGNMKIEGLYGYWWEVV